MFSIQCMTCKNFIGAGTCRAFTKIPDEIFSGEFDHRRPHPGDNGVQWEQQPGMSDPTTDEPPDNVVAESAGWLPMRNSAPRFVVE